MGGCGLPRETVERVPGGERLERSGLREAGRGRDRLVDRDERVADLARRARRPAERAPVDHDAAADARPDGEHHEAVRGEASSLVVGLRERRDRRIVVDERRPSRASRPAPSEAARWRAGCWCSSARGRSRTPRPRGSPRQRPREPRRRRPRRRPPRAARSARRCSCGRSVVRAARRTRRRASPRPTPWCLRRRRRSRAGQPTTRRKLSAAKRPPVIVSRRRCAAACTLAA